MNNNTHSLLRYVNHSVIDKIKWDEVIEQSSNSRVYAFSWYLDRVSEDWDALIWGDYEFVMPLTWRRKWGIKYLAQPCYCQQLGVFPSPSEKIQKSFLVSLKKYFKYGNINLNSQNALFGHSDISPKVNLILNLNFPYNGLYSEYSKNTRRDLKKYNEGNLSLVEGIQLNDYLDFKTDTQSSELYSACLPTFKKLSSYLVFEGKASFFGVYCNGNELCAAAFFIFHGNRIVYLNSVSSQVGKEAGAMYFLIDKMIQKYAGSKYFLDFEGSMIPGIANFFKRFGAQPETYYQLKYNHLPLPLRWLKR
jgi:hypothetical protein